MSFSFRVTLLTTLLALVLAVVAAIGTASYFNSRLAADELSTQVLDQTSLRIEHEIERMLTRAVKQAEIDRRLLASGQLAADDFPRLVAYWKNVLEVNPELTSLYIGLSSTGQATGVSRLQPGRFSVWETQVDPATRQLALREYWIDDYPDRPHTSDPAKAAPDMRERPWFTAARDAGRPVWTDSFRFLGLAGTQAVYGVTYAVPVYRSDGTLMAVLDTDFELGGLSRYLQSLSVGRAGYAFVAEIRSDGTRRLLAHPDTAVLARIRAGDDRSGRQPVDGGRGARPVASVLDQIPTDLTHGRAGHTSPIQFVHEGAPWVGQYRLVQAAGLPRWLICTVLPEAEIMHRVHQGNIQAALIGVISVVLAALASLLIAAQVARPLERLSREAEAVGQFHVEERPATRSIILEVDRLAGAMEEMKAGLRSFGKYVPADLVRQVIASRVEARLGGERRVLTTFFCDIAGFTSVAERLQPEELVQQLGEYFEALSGVICESGGTVDKYIGDAIMAFWGAPQWRSDHALVACRAALRGQAALDELRRCWQLEGKPPFETRMGIHTGEVIVGNVGSSARLNYTAIGDAVNLASRLEGLNKEYGTRILISERTYQEVNGELLARPIDVVTVKGKSEAVAVYELLGVRDASGGDSVTPGPARTGGTGGTGLPDCGGVVRSTYAR